MVQGMSKHASSRTSLPKSYHRLFPSPLHYIRCDSGTLSLQLNCEPSAHYPSTSLHSSRSATNHSKGTKHEFKSSLRQFEQQNPDYNANPALTSLRATEFGRLKSSNTTYVDYMGGGLYPDSLVSYHCQILKTQVFGNTHSDSPTCVESCSRLLFDKPPSDTSFL